MPDKIDPVALTQALVQINTVNPPGNETLAVEYLADLLEPAGFSLQHIPFGAGRSSLVATLTRSDNRYLCFSGHLDTVPVGKAAWSVDPFEAEIRGDRLYGRGSSDMKAGVAAMTSAALATAASAGSNTNLLLAYSAAEETGCEGARTMAEQVPILDRVGAMVVAEPTDNMVRLGHKGAYWIELDFKGVTAHGSMPHLGTNAVYAAAAAVQTIGGWGPELGPAGPLGAPTLNVGTFHGGMNVNSVPDAATVGIDVRTVPDFSQSEFLAKVRSLCDDTTRVRTLQELPSVYTDPSDPWVKQVLAITRAAGIADSDVAGLSYFTDAGILKQACGDVPTVFVGPGVPDLAHQTDEWCSVSKIQEAHELFVTISERFSD